MKSTIVPTLLTGLMLTTAVSAQVVPQQLSYQGYVAVDGTGFDGNGNFKFALVDANGTASYWSNDGTSVAGSEPANRVVLSVTDGLYSVALGDTNLLNMTAVSPAVFANSDVHLRIWFDDGTNGFQLLTPDQPVLSVGYAMMAEQVSESAVDGATIADGSVTAADLGPDSVNSGHIIDGEVNTQDVANNAVTTAKVANEAITTPKLADNSVNSAKLRDNIDLGSNAASGFLDLWNGSSDVRSLQLSGAAHRISTYGSDGLEQIRLYGPSWGELWLHDNEGNDRTVYLSAGNDTSLDPQLDLKSSTGLNRVDLVAGDQGGTLTLFGSGGRTTTAGAVLYGDEGNGVGALSLRNSSGNPRARVYGGPHGRMELLKNSGGLGLRLRGGANAGSLWLYNNAGEANVGLWSWDNEEGVVTVRNKLGSETIYLWGRDSADSDGGQIGLKESDGTETLTLQASEVANGGAQIVLRKSNGSASIILDADQGGDGTITTQVLRITGGSDFSESFDINAAKERIEPGMLVCIDPENPGDLVLSRRAYDRTAAGVISGAGGVNPGMIMGQEGSVANGQHPVALTGRVYCNVDAAYGSVRPGDLITTSDTPGHGMKVTDHVAAQGAIIGKAMTSLEEGKGLVLVLVSLQ